MVEESKGARIIPDQALTVANEPYEAELSSENAALYALSIGIQSDPMETKDLKFTYEDDRNFQVYPTNALALAHRGVTDFGRLGENLDDYNPMLMLHGEEAVTFIKQLVADRTYVCAERVIDVQDKKKGCLLKTETTISDKETGEAHAKVVTGLMLRKLGGFGFKGKSKDKI